MCAENTRLILPDPPAELKQLSHELAQKIRHKIVDEGAMAFSDYMEMALYTPGFGYYSAGLQKFGSGGDFVTAPQMGNVFANCMARQIAQLASEITNYTIIEAGAGSGVLAADLLKALEPNAPPQQYLILERSAHLRQVQKETLEQQVPQWMDRVAWLDAPPIEPWQGVFLANEVLDALTVERFCMAGGEINQLKVAVQGQVDLQAPVHLQNWDFKWQPADCAERLKHRVQQLIETLDEPLPDGYRSEINMSLPAWLQAVTKSMQKGVAIFIDYGYTRQQYYRPQRMDGTLICHYQHRAHGDPFSWPGLTDLSASVDFTAVAEAADNCGLEVSGYTSQSMFLIGCGLEQVAQHHADLPTAEQLRKSNEIRKLTLPDEMGEGFQVMALSRGLDETITENLCGFALDDWRYRL